MAETSNAPALTTAQEEVTKQEDSSAATEVFNNVKVSLADLCAKGISHYARKNYTEAADHFARASELQAELNGEMSPDNAEILFLYGRSVFKVGQSKSDVLGGRAGGEKKKASAKSKKSAPATEALDPVAEEGVALVAEKNGAETKKEEDAGPKKPLFTFTGDENFDDSDEEEEGEEGSDEEEEVDELADAFEVLDLARVLFERKLVEPEDGDGKGKETGDSSMTKHYKERLADVHDLLAEISLENERFPNAVSDFRASLGYKEKLYPLESEVIAEAYFKLSLALEFSSITTTKEDGDDSEVARETQFDEDMREEAAKMLEKALESTKLKLQNEEVELATVKSVDDNDVTIRRIADVKDIVADMEQRLLDLRAPPVDVNAAIAGPAGAANGINPMSGILAAALGESPAEVQARVEEATKTATDLSGLVRKKKAPKVEEPAAPAAGTNGNGKRQLEEVEENEVDTKKAKVEDTIDAQI